MAARAAMAASSLISRSSSPAARLLPRRPLSGGGDYHGPPKVDFWKDPMSPSTWKEEHFVLISLAGWGALIYTGFKAFSGGKDKKEKA